MSNESNPNKWFYDKFCHKCSVSKYVQNGANNCWKIFKRKNKLVKLLND